VLYFAYGSNMDQVDLDDWCDRNGFEKIRFKQVTPAKLSGYRLVFDHYSSGRNGGAANIEESDRDRVYGLLIEMDDKYLDAIRNKEGYPYIYEEIKVTVKSKDGKVYSNVMTYQVVPEKRKSSHQKPTEYYLNLILNNAKKYGFPNEYIRFLNQVETI